MVIRDEAKLVDRGDDIVKSKANLAAACTLTAVELSQDRDTKGAIKQVGKRYAFVLDSPLVAAESLALDIQGLLSLARAA